MRPFRGTLPTLTKTPDDSIGPFVPAEAMARDETGEVSLRAGRVDTILTMDELDLLQLQRNPDWQTTLQVYDALQQRQQREQSPDSAWVARQTEIPGIEPDRLSAIHGKLIAFGLLRFDVGGRDVGVQYQVTPLGRRAVSGQGDSIGDVAELAESA